MSSDKVILLAEDDVVNQKTTTLSLEGLGYKITLARNGKEAVAAVKTEQKFSVILMDCLRSDFIEMAGSLARKRFLI